MLKKLKKTFRNSLRTRLLNEMEERNFLLAKMTSKEDLLDWISSLRPLAIDSNLIRLGPNGDGGYLVPNDLEGINLLLSPGVDVESGFEWDCAEKGMEVHLIDESVESPAIQHPNFHFHPFFLGMDSEKISLDEFVSNHQLWEKSGDWMMQMDIEGAEWETLMQVSDSLMNRFRILVIEFHGLDNMFYDAYFDLGQKLFQKLLKTHAVVHLHPNNAYRTKAIRGIEIPRYMEFTFLRRDRIPFFGSGELVFPHPLDRDCTINPSYPLPEIWAGK